MRKLMLSAAVGLVGLGFAAAAQAGPSSTPIKPLTGPSSQIEQVRDGCGYNRHRVCRGYGYDRKCYCVRNYG